jgi:Secretion system C-terminal sorting domain
MKKIIYSIILLISSFGFSQQDVLITFQDGNFTSSNGSLFAVNYITDPGLNQILNNHNATYLNEVMASCSWRTKIMATIPSSQNAANFINELSAYNTVVLDAQLIGINPNCGYCYDMLSISLLDPNNGSFQSITNSIVQTNNADLNAIFQTYNVFEYSTDFSNIPNIRCNCNISDLKTSLQDLNSVIANVDNASCSLAWLLKNEKFENSKPNISPNPFSTTFEINSKQPIDRYKLFDLIGKHIVTTNSKQELDSKTETLKSGVYLLELTFDKGKSDTLKLIKN